MKYTLLLILFPLLSFSQDSLNMTLLGQYDYLNTNGNDIWGWVAPDQSEYAIVGLVGGVSVVNVTDPSNPIEEFFIADLSSTWRDIKTWGHYAYVTTEADAGLLIIDLSDMTGNTYYHQTIFNNSNGSSTEFTSAHNLYIDENGIAYIFGAAINSGPPPSNGAIFLDVDTDPIDPIYLGEWDDHYIHDGMARGDTMYVGCIYVGDMFIVDVSDKSNPVNLGNISTPTSFTHNAWVSDNGNYVYTTDEKPNAYIGSYDITDVNNIQEVDRIQSNPGSNSIPHNAHVDGNFLFTSYYRDGTVVHDITNPNHLVQVAYYDSYPLSGNGYDGCWGTYPFLPSGNIISSDRNIGSNNHGRLLIFSRDFQQACYINGNVFDASSGAPIANASISILNTNFSSNSNLLGFYQTAVLDSGSYQVVFSANGYQNDTLTAVFDNGVTTVMDGYLSISCFSPKPDSLFIYDIIDNRAKIGWRNMNSSDCRVWKYFVRYREVGSPSWITKSAGVGNGLCNSNLNTTTKQLINLTPNTTYEFKMKAFYCNVSSSGYSLPVQFTTLDTCPDMLNLAVSTFTNNVSKARFSWDLSSSYVFARIKYRVDTSSSSWNNAGGFGIYYPINSINTFGLQSGTHYRAHGRLFCDSSITAYRSPSWTQPPVFWTQPGSPIRVNGGLVIDEILISPNPSNGIFYIGFDLKDLQDFKITITNLLGEDLYSEERINYIGEFKRKIDFNNYPSSIYFVNILSSEFNISKKVVLQ